MSSTLPTKTPTSEKTEIGQFDFGKIYAQLSHDSHFHFFNFRHQITLRELTCKEAIQILKIVCPKYRIMALGMLSLPADGQFMLLPTEHLDYIAKVDKKNYHEDRFALIHDSANRFRMVLVPKS